MQEKTTYELSYTGYDGLDRTMIFTGTAKELREQMSFLEDHGCHLLYACEEDGTEFERY